jgi:ATP-binding cassette subfamily C (CFTR/MRP) protein 4
MFVQGQVSYASQQPWIFSGSIRENILFGETYKASHYWKVLESCSLMQDLAALKYGDDTLVGDRGVILSGMRGYLGTS